MKMPKKSRTKTPKVAKKAKTPLDWPEFTLIGILVASVLLIAVSMLLQMSFNPRGDAEAAMEKLADAYYRGHLYPQLLDYQIDRPEKLETYAETGVPTTYLRQLLDYNDSKQVVATKVFNNQYYQCDTNHTGVRYYPHAPYGPRDYTVKYFWSCVDRLAPKTTPKETSWTEDIEPSDKE